MNETIKPSVALLSNSEYSVMVTDAGAGYSTWRSLDVTRWREDATRGCWGQVCYVRDVTADRIWSVVISRYVEWLMSTHLRFTPIGPSLRAGTATWRRAGPFVSSQMRIARCAR